MLTKLKKGTVMNITRNSPRLRGFNGRLLLDMMLILGGFVKVHLLGNVMAVPRRDCSRRPPGIRNMMTMLTRPELRIVKIIHRRDYSGLSKRSGQMVIDQPHTDQSWLRRVSRVDPLSKEVRLMRPLL